MKTKLQLQIIKQSGAESTRITEEHVDMYRRSRVEYATNPEMFECYNGLRQEAFEIDLTTRYKDFIEEISQVLSMDSGLKQTVLLFMADIAESIAKDLGVKALITASVALEYAAKEASKTVKVIGPDGFVERPIEILLD